ncbi:MAG: hypothetical protein GXO77_16030 [Calditrichaeota bacterium]|nr:hypothetical protein [Calditrichota bacterium]
MEQVYLGFKLDNKTFGIAIDKVKRVSQIVEIIPLPKSPRIILGLINVFGEAVPVLNIRYRLGFPKRDIRITDHLIIIRKNNFSMAFVVDQVSGLIPLIDDNDIPLKKLISRPQLIERVIRQNDEFVLILNFDKLLSFRETQRIEKLLKDENEKIQEALAAYQP